MCAAHSGLGMSLVWFSFMPRSYGSGPYGRKRVGCHVVSRTGQHADAAAEGPGQSNPAVVVASFPMPPGTVFDWHTHEDHQLAWASSGVLTVITEQATWVLPPTRALWIPAGLRHETGAAGRATMRSAYVRPGRLTD